MTNKFRNRLECKSRLNYVYKYLRAVSNEQFGFPITTHILRHNFAIELLNLGVSITIISRLLGHSSTETTKLNLHITKEQNQETVNLLNE